jgi:hypothetical protein
MKTLERQEQSEQLEPHGSYPEDWRIRSFERDAEGDFYNAVYILCFSRIMRLTAHNVRHFVAEAMNVEPESWMLPGNKEFVIFRCDIDFGYVYGVYKHDDSYYLIKGNINLIQQYLEKKSVVNRNKRLLDALNGNFFDSVVPMLQTCNNL